MASTRDIKRRIRSVKNIAQITKAMEVVSMTKMRRSQLFALAARPFALASVDMLKNILKFSKKIHIPEFLRMRLMRHVALVVVTTDKGLVGGFNDSVLNLAEVRMHALEDKKITVDIITVGKKGKEYFERRGITPVFHVDEYGDYTSFAETKPVAEKIFNGYKDKQWDAVYVEYTHFKTTLKQKATERKLLPTTESVLEDIIEEIIPEYGRFSGLLKQQNEQQTKYNYTYTFEPSAGQLIEGLVTNLLLTSMHHIFLESNASEHSSRMVTMKSASDNALDLKDRLTLEYNKVRQAGITAEISEIVAGAEALQ